MVALPAAGAACPQPKLRTTSSTFPLLAPPLEFALPPLEFATPPLEFATPPLEFATPPLEFATPPLEFATPPLEFATPPVEFATPPVEFATPPVPPPGAGVEPQPGVAVSDTERSTRVAAGRRSLALISITVMPLSWVRPRSALCDRRTWPDIVRTRKHGWPPGTQMPPPRRQKRGGCARLRPHHQLMTSLQTARSSGELLAATRGTASLG